MKVIIDTSVWSMALRHNVKSSDIKSIKKEIFELINESRVVLLGVILQEILSGIKNDDQFSKLEDSFKPFSIEIFNRNYYVKAAEFFNNCRTKGIQGSHIDFYICAVAYLNNWEIFTFDNDFSMYSKIINIKMYKSRFF